MRVEEFHNGNFKNQCADESRKKLKVYSTRKRPNSSKQKAYTVENWQYRIPKYFMEIDLND